MSIINDALKKAEQEGESRSPLTPFLNKEVSQNKYPRPKFILPAVSVISIIFAFIFFFNLFSRKTNLDKVGPEKEKVEKVKKATSSSRDLAMLAKTTKVAAQLTLSGIVFSKEGPSWALINDNIVREGDTVGGAKLLKIEEDFVELAFPDKKLILNVIKQ